MTAQEFMQEWEKKNNPFYPNEMRWDRAVINNMLFDYDEVVKKLSSNPVLADSLPTQCVKEWENSDYCSERGKCQKCL